MLNITRSIVSCSRLPSSHWIHREYFCALSIKLNNEQFPKKSFTETKSELLLGKHFIPHDYLRLYRTSQITQNAINNATSPHKTSAAPWVLGASGLIPFVTPPILMFTQGVTCPELLNYQLYYGAVILSFLGGVRWGMAVIPGSPIPGNWSQYSWSVVPSLLAWGGLMLPGVYPGLSSIILGIGITCFNDLKQTGYPSWFKGLRILLTVVAMLSMSSSLIIMYNYKNEKPLPEVILTTKKQIEDLISMLKTSVEEKRTPEIKTEEAISVKLDDTSKIESEDTLVKSEETQQNDASVEKDE